MAMGNDIPAELRKQKRWAAWKYEKAWTKKEKPAYICEPKTWLSYEEAVGLGGDCVAFAITDDDPYIVVSLKNITDDPTSGKYDQLAIYISQKLNAYTEWRHGHNGFTIITKGRLPVGTSGLSNGQIEVFDRFRFVPLSGRHVPKAPMALEDRQKAIDTFWKKFFPGKTLVTDEVGLTDDQVIQRATKAHKNFAELMESGPDEDDPAEEDGCFWYGLLRIFAFWTRRDVSQMLRLFDDSELSSHPKWNRASFRESVIRTALAGGVDIKLLPVAKTNGDEKGEAIASAFAEEHVGKPKGLVYETTFKLARRLHSLGGKPDRFQKAVEAVAEKLGYEKEEFWFSFYAVWSKVKFSEEDGVFEKAVRLAQEQPIKLDSSPGESYEHAASIAYHLGHLRPDGIFCLTREKLGKALGVSARRATDIVRMLEANNFVECVDDTYCFAGQKTKSMEYKLGESAKLQPVNRSTGQSDNRSFGQSV